MEEVEEDVVFGGVGLKRSPLTKKQMQFHRISTVNPTMPLPHGCVRILRRGGVYVGAFAPHPMLVVCVFLFFGAWVCGKRIIT